MKNVHFGLFIHSFSFSRRLETRSDFEEAIVLRKVNNLYFPFTSILFLSLSPLSTKLDLILRKQSPPHFIFQQSEQQQQEQSIFSLYFDTRSSSKLDPKKQSPPHFVFQAKLAARTIYIFVTPSAHQLATKLDLIFEKRQSPPQSNNLYFTSILFSLLSKLDPKRAISSTFHIPQCGRKPAAGTIISIRKNFPSFPSFLPSFLPSVPEGLRSRQEVASVDAIIPLSSSSFFFPRFTISIRSYCHEKRRIEATHEKKNAWIFFFRDLFPFSLSLYKVQVYGAQYAWLPPPVDLRFFSLKGPRVDIDRSCARTRNPSLLFSVPIPFLVIFFVRLAATNLLIEKILFQIFLILKSRITYHRNKLEKFYNNNSGQRNSFKLVSFPMEDKFM